MEEPSYSELCEECVADDDKLCDECSQTDPEQEEWK